VTGSLGYERNNAATDINAFTNTLGDIASPIHGTLTDNTRGNSVTLDGVDDHIDLGGMTDLENQSTFTFETWIKPITIDANSERIFSKRSDNSNRIEISLGDGATDSDRQFLTINICNGTSETASIPNGSVPVGEWTHIAVVFDGTKTGSDRLKVFANGIAQDVVSANNGTFVNEVLRFSSTINTGNSNFSNSQTITAISNTGLQSFSDAQLAIDFTTKTGTEDLTVTHQNYTSNSTSGIDATEIYDYSTWTINSSSITATSIADFTFIFPSETFSSLDPLKYNLYHRTMNTDGAWEKIAIASSLTSSTITFSNIVVFGQFIIVQQTIDGVSPIGGNMYTFDGVDDYIDFGNPAGFNITNNITIDAWVKMMDVNGDQKIVTKFGDIADDDAYALQAINGEPQFLLNFGSSWTTVSAGMTMNAGEWYHVAGVYDGATMKIYVNGVEQNAIAQTGAFDISASSFKIGAWSGGGNWNGSIDEVRVWDDARTQTELRENLHLTLKGSESNLLAYYQFNSDDPAGTIDGVKDALGLTSGLTFNTAVEAYTTSEVAVAGGVAQTLTIPSAGPYTANYSSVGMEIEFGAVTPDGEVVVSRLETQSPDGANTITGQADDEYFVINNYGVNTTFTNLTSLSLLNVGYIDPVDAAESELTSPLVIYKRPSNAFGASWGASLANASAATSGHNGTLMFDNSAGITSFSQIVFANNNSVVPVELVKFNAIRKDAEKVLLSWETESETNSEGFQIERMFDDESSFKKIAWINGQGNATISNSYQIIDTNNNPGVSYYRLKLIDLDGTISYSEIRSVDGGANDKFNNLSIYPNPVGEQIHITFKQMSKDITPATISILSIDGKRLYQYNTEVESNQTIVLGDIGVLNSGVYMIMIETGEEIISQKIIKE